MWGTELRKAGVSKAPRSRNVAQNSKLRSKAALIASALAVATLPSACWGV